MFSSLQRFKRKALAKPGGREAYDALEDEFAFLDEVLKARVESGLTQAEVAERAGTTQSAIARLERGGRPPKLDTLMRIADALDAELFLEMRLRPSTSE